MVDDAWLKMCVILFIYQYILAMWQKNKAFFGVIRGMKREAAAQCSRRSQLSDIVAADCGDIASAIDALVAYAACRACSLSLHRNIKRPRARWYNTQLAAGPTGFRIIVLATCMIIFYFIIVVRITRRPCAGMIGRQAPKSNHNIPLWQRCTPRSFAASHIFKRRAISRQLARFSLYIMIL